MKLTSVKKRWLFIGALWLVTLGSVGSYLMSRPTSTVTDTTATNLAGKKIPGASLPTLEPYRAEWGDTLVLGELAGRRPLVINFWASWCVPCRREASLLQAAWQTYKTKILFIGVNYRDQEADALKFIEEFGVTYPSGADFRGEAGLAFGLFGVPTTYFVAPDGVIQAQKVGELSAEELDAYLKELVAAVPAVAR